MKFTTRNKIPDFELEVYNKNKVSLSKFNNKKAWTENLELENLNLLSDFWPHGELASKLGIFIEKAGISGRVNTLIDEVLDEVKNN